MTNLTDSVNQLAAEVAGLAGNVVVLNRDVQHMVATYVPRDELEEKERARENALKQRRVTLISTCLLGLIILSAFGWVQHQSTLRQEKVNKEGAAVILCLYGEIGGHRHFDRLSILEVAQALGPEVYARVKEYSDATPKTAFDSTKLTQACQPIADAINSGKFDYGMGARK